MVVVSDASELLSHLRERLDYDPNQGAFFRKAGFRGVVAGARIGCPDSAGKLQATFLGVRHQVDRLVWLWETGTLPSDALLHVDGNNGNDRFENLSEGRRSPILDANRVAFRGEVAARFGATIDASAAQYVGRDKPVAFKCHLHGAFKRSPGSLLVSSHGCPTCCREHHLAKVRKTPEEKRATALARALRHQQRRRASGRTSAAVKKWREKIKGTDPERWAKLLESQAPKDRARSRAWTKTDKGRKHGRLQRAARRARLKTLASAGLSPAQWDAICAAHMNEAGDVCCKYCKQPCSPTIDHVVPIARGGRHEPSNVVPACRACNSSKAAHLIHEWPKARRLLAPQELAALTLHTTRHLSVLLSYSESARVLG